MWGCWRSASVRRGLAVQRSERRRCYSSLSAVLEDAATPVSDDEFFRALVKVLPQARWGLQKHVGLAISGGVDSMALAQLYSRLTAYQTNLPKAHGIIIDHKVRPESTEEARWVADQLKTKLGIPSTIVPLEWPEDVDFSSLRSFETAARRLRYQALGLTCKAYDINSLLVAHHGDDQAETVLMRLMKSRLRTGLQGMQAQEWIPECHGMYGIHRSGTPMDSRALPFPIESGGICVLRPLLNFEKQRLIATCRANDMSWAEDATNKDPTLTSRNAIRHILSTSTLPKALSKPTLISLAQRMQHRVQTHKNQADSIFDTTPMELNVQLGALTVHFPPSHVFLPDPDSTAELTESALHAARNTAHLYLHRITELVTPKENNSIGGLATAIDTIWPSLRIENHTAILPAEFCVFGLMFRPEPAASKPAPNNKSRGLRSRSNPRAEAPQRSYLITRQPPSPKERTGTFTSLVIPARTDAPTPFHLFDNRFWLSLTNHTPHDMHVRFLDANDVRLIAKGDKKYFQLRKIVLGAIKPVDTRTTIPAVFMRRGEGPDAQEELVGFPTLDAAARGVRQDCRWEVRYRKVELGGRDVGDVVVGREKWIGGSGKKPVGRV